MTTYTKDPDALLDYGEDWSAWLPGDDTVATSTWTVETIVDDDAALIKDPDKGDTHDDTTTTIWLSGGTVGEVYKLTNHVVSTEGREDDRSFWVQIRER